MQYKPIYGASGKFVTLCWSQVDLVSVPCNTNLCVEPVGSFVTFCVGDKLI